MVGELPKGLVAFPELGDDVVGTRVAESARWLLWAKGAVWIVLALVALGFTVQSLSVVTGLLLGVVLALACGYMASGNLALALRGDRPALTVDASTMRCLIPMNRAEIDLRAITRVERIRHDLLIEARGGIARRGLPSRARWMAVHSAHTFEVSRSDLVDYLSARATASRSPDA
jgi:hypothetical protein